MSFSFRQNKIHPSLNLVLFFLVAFVFFLYILPSSPPFPPPPPDSVQSLEDADTENVFRRSYFTNLNREQVREHYQTQIGNVRIFSLTLPSFVLNYPPEDAFTIIRDQTRSTFLEEIVHPMRESIYVNGFQPKFEKDDIWYKGIHYNLKITVKYAPSPTWLRIVLFGISYPILWYAARMFGLLVIRLIKEWRQYA